MLHKAAEDGFIKEQIIHKNQKVSSAVPPSSDSKFDELEEELANIEIKALEFRNGVDELEIKAKRDKMNLGPTDVKDK